MAATRPYPADRSPRSSRRARLDPDFATGAPGDPLEPAPTDDVGSFGDLFGVRSVLLAGFGGRTVRVWVVAVRAEWPVPGFVPNGRLRPWKVWARVGCVDSGACGVCVFRWCGSGLVAVGVQAVSVNPSLFQFLRQKLERCPSCGVRRYKHGRGDRQDLPFGPGYFHGRYQPFRGMR